MKFQYGVPVASENHFYQQFLVGVVVTSRALTSVPRVRFPYWEHLFALFEVWQKARVTRRLRKVLWRDSDPLVTFMPLQTPSTFSVFSLCRGDRTNLKLPSDAMILE